jgi:hypothetical protein
LTSEGDGQIDPNSADGFRAMSGQDRLRIGQLAKHIGADDMEGGPGVRQFEGARRSLEQSAIQPRLKAGHALADGGNCQVETLCRGGETAKLRGRDEGINSLEALGWEDGKILSLWMHRKQ